MFISLRNPTRNLKILLDTRLGIIPHVTPLYFITKSYSSILPNKKFDSEIEKEHSFTVSYLVNSCGLSLENAIKASQKVHFETPDQPDSVLCLFKRHGFTDSNISQFTRIGPEFLVYNPEKTILPKLNFLRSIGISETVVAKMISSNPCILGCSLDNHIIPFYKGLRSVLNDNEKVVVALKNQPRILHHSFESKIAPNVSVLREHGVPKSSISFMLCRHGILFTQSRYMFEKYAKEVIEMGFNSSALVFVIALKIIGTTSESTWNRKNELLTRLGWSEEEFRRAFRSHPSLMCISDTKITSAFEFLMDEIGLESAVIARNPALLSLSLQKRIIPRGSVIKVLLLKGLIEKINIFNSFFVTEKVFLDKFVTKYEGYVPELLVIYKDSRSIVDSRSIYKDMFLSL